MIAALFAALAFATASPSPTPDVPVYAGNPATHFTIEPRFLGVDPDGALRVLLLARFLDAQGQATAILANSDLDWRTDHGTIQWQNRMRYDTPSAIVSTVDEQPIVATVHANLPAIGTVVVRIDPRAWKGLRTVAGALGPHLARIGTFPATGDAMRYHDVPVEPGARYHGVTIPREPPASTSTVIAGKGMWLFWSLNPLDPEFFGNLDPQRIALRASQEGIRYVELRMTYGEEWLVPPQAKPVIDALIDAFADRGITPIAWSVPRAVSFDDLAATARAVGYRTAGGTPLYGVALDLERGDEFLGDDTSHLWMYERELRKAFGPHLAIIATIEDPALEHLDETSYPYREVARYADALQPMAYWQHDAAAMIPQSYTTLLALTGHTRPISVGVLAPPDGTTSASAAAAAASGAAGICVFGYQWILK
jgi:hypothetical protein